MDLFIKKNYPFATNPVHVTFLTPIFHPAFDEYGELYPSIEGLFTSQTAAFTLEKRLITIISILCNPEDYLPEPLTETGQSSDHITYQMFNRNDVFE